MEDILTQPFSFDGEDSLMYPPSPSPLIKSYIQFARLTKNQLVRTVEYGDGEACLLTEKERFNGMSDFFDSLLNYFKMDETDYNRAPTFLRLVQVRLNSKSEDGIPLRELENQMENEFLQIDFVLKRFHQNVIVPWLSQLAGHFLLRPKSSKTQKIDHSTLPTLLKDWDAKHLHTIGAPGGEKKSFLIWPPVSKGQMRFYKFTLFTYMNTFKKFFRNFVGLDKFDLFITDLINDDWVIPADGETSKDVYDRLKTKYAAELHTELMKGLDNEKTEPPAKKRRKPNPKPNN